MGCTSPHNLGNLGHNDTSDFKIRLLRRRPLFELSLEDDTAALRCHYCFAKLVRLYGYTVDVDVIVFLYLSSTNLRWRKKKTTIYEIHLPLYDFPYISHIVFSFWSRSSFFLKRPSVEPAFGSPILQYCMKTGRATWRTPWKRTQFICAYSVKGSNSEVLGCSDLVLPSALSDLIRSRQA